MLEDFPFAWRKADHSKPVAQDRHFTRNVPMSTSTAASDQASRYEADLEHITLQRFLANQSTLNLVSQCEHHLEHALTEVKRLKKQTEEMAHELEFRTLSKGSIQAHESRFEDVHDDLHNLVLSKSPIQQALSCLRNVEDRKMCNVGWSPDEGVFLGDSSTLDICKGIREIRIQNKTWNDSESALRGNHTFKENKMTIPNESCFAHIPLRWDAGWSWYDIQSQKGKPAEQIINKRKTNTDYTKDSENALKKANAMKHGEKNDKPRSKTRSCKHTDCDQSKCSRLRSQRASAHAKAPPTAQISRAPSYPPLLQAAAKQRTYPQYYSVDQNSILQRDYSSGGECYTREDRYHYPQHSGQSYSSPQYSHQSYCPPEYCGRCYCSPEYSETSYRTPRSQKHNYR